MVALSLSDFLSVGLGQLFPRPNAALGRGRGDLAYNLEICFTSWYIPIVELNNVPGLPVEIKWVLIQSQLANLDSSYESGGCANFPPFYCPQSSEKPDRCSIFDCHCLSLLILSRL